MQADPVKRDLTATDDLTKIFDRPTWAEKAVTIFNYMPIADVQLIVAGGQSEFLVVARRGFAGQGFQQEDFLRMFMEMEVRVAKHQRTHAPIELTDA